MLVLAQSPVPYSKNPFQGSLQAAKEPFVRLPEEDVSQVAQTLLHMLLNHRSSRRRTIRKYFC